MVLKRNFYDVEERIEKFIRVAKRYVQAKITEKDRASRYRKQTQFSEKKMKKTLGEMNSLFISHDYGGGTRAYERNFLREYNNLAIFRHLRYEFMKEDYFQIEFYKDGELVEAPWLIKDTNIEWIFENEYNEIMLNSLVTYQNVFEILGDLISYKETHPNCIIKYFVHDFHGVCPNVNLFINNQYCEVKCEKNKCQLFIGKKNINIREWRNRWEVFFEKVNEIRFFSESSKDIFKLAYPSISKEVLKVVPHDMSYCKNNPIVGIENMPLCIGIVGGVASEPKGKQIVKYILRNYGKRVPIRMIGTQGWRFHIFKRNIKYFGPYKRDELRDILVREKVSLIVFPSLCPETFSYLVSELIAFDLPIICFDCGAQAEKVKKYNKGIVCNNRNEMYAIIERMANLK